MMVFLYIRVSLMLLFTTATAIVTTAFHVIVADRALGFSYAGFQLAYAITDAESKTLYIDSVPVV